MTKTIAFANASGSAGKTTSAVTLAVLLAQSGRRVVVVDSDAQANATAWLGIPPDSASVTLADVLMRRATLADALLETEIANVSVVPANRDLDQVSIELNTVVARETRLRTALKGIDTDVVLIDCPGAIGLLTISALVAADSLITVTQPGMKEAEGIPEMLDTLDDVQEMLNPALHLAGIIPCITPVSDSGKIYGGKIYSDTLELITRTYGDDVTPPVRRSGLVPTAFARHQTLPVLAPRERVTDDYRAVLAWMESKGVL